MDRFSSRKKMSNVKFFIIALVISIVLVLAISFISSEGGVVPAGLLVAVLVSLFLTLFRILKKSNDPDNRLGGWMYFLALFIFVTGILTLGMLLVTKEEGSIPVSLFVGLIISSIVSIIRSVKYGRREKKAEKERDRQLQEHLQRENKQYADELKRKDRIINDLRSRNSELQSSKRTVYTATSSSSSSRYNDQYQEQQMERQREQMRRQEEEDKRKERLEDWYREYVTIEVSFQYHVRDAEYNQDYWDYRSEDIRVSRREAMALIEAGDHAILGKLGYGNWGLIRNFSYKVPYRLYDRPMGC